MSSTITLAQLRTQVLDRADLTSSDFPVEARVSEYVNAALGELYDVLVTEYEDYFVETDDVTIVAGTENYSLPSDFYKCLRVFYKSGNQRWDLFRFTMNELADNVYYDAAVATENRYLRYRVLGDEIYFYPLPAAGGTVEIFYIPEIDKFLNDGSEDSTAIKFGVPVQWEEYVVITAAIKLLDREESDTMALRATKQELERKMRAAAVNRDAGQPNRIMDRNSRFSRRRNYMR